MDRIYEQILTHLERGVNLLARQVPQPKWVEVGNFSVFRHMEKTIYQALVQKLARMVSTLDATRLLLNNGFVQEQASLQRILDEIQDDVMFLVFGVLRGDHESPLHRSYLGAFFEEEFDANTPIESTQKRPMIPRKKIRAYLSKSGFSSIDPSSGIELLRTMNKVYSGYVHAASPQIMDMYGGEPSRFHMRGMLGTGVYDGHRKDISNYFLRGIGAIALGTIAFEDKELFDRYRNLFTKYEVISSRKFEET